MLNFSLPKLPDAAAPGNLVQLPELKRVVRVYDQDVPGRRIVRFLMGVQGASPGSPSQALVQFDDSRDVYLISLADGSVTLLASSTVSQGTLGYIPELADDHEFVWRTNHEDFGYIYVFAFEDNVSPNMPSTLVLLDADRNETVESYMLVAPRAWKGSPWDDDSKYIWD